MQRWWVRVKKYLVNRWKHDMILPSNNASSDMWNSNGSSVESVTLSPRLNSFGNGFWCILRKRKLFERGLIDSPTCLYNSNSVSALLLEGTVMNLHWQIKVKMHLPDPSSTNTEARPVYRGWYHDWWMGILCKSQPNIHLYETGKQTPLFSNLVQNLKVCPKVVQLPAICRIVFLLPQQRLITWKGCIHRTLVIYQIKPSNKRGALPLLDASWCVILPQTEG